MAFHPDGSLLACGTTDGRLVLLSAADGTVVANNQAHHGWVCTVAFDATGRRLVTTGDDGAIRLWDATTGQRAGHLAGHMRAVRAAAFHPDGRQFATGSDDGSIRIWDMDTGALRSEFVMRRPATAIVFHPDGHLFAAAEGDTISIREANNVPHSRHDPVAEISGTARPLTTVVFSADGTNLTSTAVDGTTYTWETATGRHLGRRITRSGSSSGSGPGDGGQVLTGPTSIVSPDGRFHAAADGTSLRVTDPRTDTPIGRLTGHLGPVTALAVTPDGGGLLASVSTDGTVRLWDPATLTAVATLLGFSGGAWAVLLPDGTYKLDGNPRGDLWWAMGRCRFEPGELDGFTDPPRRLAPTEPFLALPGVHADPDPPPPSPPLAAPPATQPAKRRRFRSG